MKALIVSFILIAAAFSAEAATAKSIRLNQQMSPDQLRSACGASGGNFGNNQSGDGVCLSQGGNVVICGKDKKCVAGVPGRIVAPGDDHDGFTAPVSFGSDLVHHSDAIKASPLAHAAGLQLIQ